MRRINWKITLSSAWLVLTFSLVTWWFIFAMRSEETQTLAEIRRHQRMIFWEGSTLLLSVIIGGLFLIIFTYRDSQRHEKLKFFFSNFSHDIKTSISRLRLQAEILSENKAFAGVKNLEKLMADLTRLDLQLENSLLLTHVDDALFIEEKIKIQSLIASLQIEFEQLKIQVSGDAEIMFDLRALKSILRNIFENSIVHGKASAATINLTQKDAQMVEITIQDNGQGTTRKVSELGVEILPTQQSSSNGIGLYLARKLMQKMKGKIEFMLSPSGGFATRLTIKGKVL